MKIAAKTNILDAETTSAAATTFVKFPTESIFCFSVKIFDVEIFRFSLLRIIYIGEV